MQLRRDARALEARSVFAVKQLLESMDLTLA